MLIVGQGLAGSLLASELEDQQKSFVVIDQYLPGAASLLAAGIINPVTGRRYVKSWKYDELVPIFIKTYEDITSKLACQVLFEHDILLGLSSIKEENDLLSQSLRYQYEDLISQADEKRNYLSASIRSVYKIKGYRLDIKTMLHSLRSIWKLADKLIEEQMIYTDLRHTSKGWEYHGIIAQHIVFCEGAAVIHNPYFKNLPILGNKGQLLLIETPELELNATFKHHLVVSGYKNKQWVGATYEWKYNSVYPSEEGMAELRQKLSEMLITPFRIDAHHAGIRPTTADRRPLIALHPEFNTMWALNGLGTKGSSLAPFLIKKFIPHLFGPDMENEFDAKRLIK